MSYYEWLLYYWNGKDMQIETNLISSWHLNLLLQCFKNKDTAFVDILINTETITIKKKVSEIVFVKNNFDDMFSLGSVQDLSGSGVLWDWERPRTESASRHGWV